jgi:transcriptional regulator with XRE-family HTH domain
MLARVKALRLAAGMDQKELAKVAGWHNTNWCSLEQGRARLPKARQERVAEHFGVPSEMLFTDKGEVRPVTREELLHA